MLDHLTHDDFARHLSERFEIALSDGERLALALDEVTPLGAVTAAAGGGRRPFSLLFRHPRRDAFLPQRTYQLEHPTLGTLALFLVPLGPDGAGMRYEAIFT